MLRGYIYIRKYNIQSFDLLFITDDSVKHPNLPANLPAFPEQGMRNARATQAPSWPS
jgi:hypothetical protein